MASGRQVAEENLQKFSAWVASKSDADFRALASRGVLSRTEIAKECGFAKSALAQNPRIRDALRELEDVLRVRGVLPPTAAVPLGVEAEPPLRQSDGTRSAREVERLKRLEQENASLRAENSELKKQLERYAVRNRSLSGVLCPPAPTRNNPSHIHQGGAGSDQGDSDQQQVAAA